MSDIETIAGAERSGISVTVFRARSPRGREWMAGWAGSNEAEIETAEADLVVGCIEQDGLTVKAWSWQ